MGINKRNSNLKLYTARCDVDNCENIINSLVMCKEFAVSDFKNQGWQVNPDGTCYCPECKEVK